jgi:ABC-type molybdenum transport system ATPase subunit/photorepair protein PhrA
VKESDSLVSGVTMNHLVIEISDVNFGRRQSRLLNSLTTKVEAQTHWKQSSASFQLLYSL